MKIKKLMCIAILPVLTLLIFMAGDIANAKVFNGEIKNNDLQEDEVYHEEINNNLPENTIREEEKTSPHIFSYEELFQSEEEYPELRELSELENQNGEMYLRKRSEIISGCTFSRRITLEEVRNIIKQYPQDFAYFDQIIYEIQMIHGNADVDGGSGIYRIDYWLNESGSEKIVVWLNLIVYYNVNNTEENLILFNPTHTAIDAKNLKFNF